MSRWRLLAPITDALSGRQFKPTVVLLVSTLMLVTWKYYFSPAFYLSHLADWLVVRGNPQMTAAVYSFVGAFVVLGLVPVLVVRFVFHERLADYGVGLGDRVRTVRSFLMCAPFVVLIAYAASRDPACRAEYPIDRSLVPGAFALHAAFYFLYYLGWEFHFRGFLQFGLRGSMSDTSALMVQVLASVIMHLGKPASETYASIIAAVLWGALAYRTRSLLSGTLQHALLGISLDWFICSSYPP